MGVHLYRSTIESPIGVLTLVVGERGVCGIEFGDHPGPSGAVTSPSHTRELARQLEAYFQGRRRRFDLPLTLDGTPFQLRVWNALLDIPFGTTASYADVARAIGHPRAGRAVGGANRRNPIPIIVPCHRVIGSNGDLVGYAGRTGLAIKRYLLDLEQA